MDVASPLYDGDQQEDLPLVSGWKTMTDYILHSVPVEISQPHGVLAISPTLP